ncbi:4-hydroxy-tetrahydrodipicolinate reductase [Zongyangia hominis]|uniref:4-hydroxy-tetrahydrodipicolinate reductase n=1 Tax=Zongyangia hominis TaxID=2763677 RepID=A0A926EBZ7_9FIRM|nr:4-hydroxy-tetrahydrodipicolinate reductase [Zongyangia hominis]MBC8569569.1 4-hydroxy-tetrahydrodipicolinate reductase [Zongyangia hominis]
MKQIILSGCNGKMGHVISNIVAGRDDCTIVAGIDINTQRHFDYPVFAKPSDYAGGADVIIDFSHPSVLTPLLAFSKERGIPVVLATTGYSKAQIEEIHAAAKGTPVFFTANMSLGINLMVELAKKAAGVLGDSFDIEIIEKHHNQKIDAPSGTALMIADAVSGVLDEKPQYVYDRHSQRKKRDKNEIGIHAVRGGTIVGEHDIMFAGRDEILTISHTAMSKEVFASGAVNAAVFMCGKTAGLYNMKDMV